MKNIFDYMTKETTVSEFTPEDAAEVANMAAANDAYRKERIGVLLDDQGSVNKVLLKISFLQENRIRVLEGNPEITADQFRTWVDGQID